MCCHAAEPRENRHGKTLLKNLLSFFVKQVMAHLHCSVLSYQHIHVFENCFTTFGPYCSVNEPLMLVVHI